MDALYPNWLVANHIHALTTFRHGGMSHGPYASFNLATHVGDKQNTVKHNRMLLVEQFRLPQHPLFLNQIHSTRVITLPYMGDNLNADAVYTNQPNQVCLVMTADCLPVLLTNQQGNEVAAVHAGWRGLCNGILEETIKSFNCPKEDIIAWLGPAIGPTAFQVGYDVVELFVAEDPQAEDAFLPDPNEQGKYLGNLYQIATQRLNNMDITQITGGERCTYIEKNNFFSFRRELKTGRMASLIWFE